MDIATPNAEQPIQSTPPKPPLPVAVWIWIKELAAILKPCRFSVLVVLIGSFALIAVPQCQEALRGLAERDEVPELIWKQWTTFFIAALLWAFNAWYWARQMLHIRFPTTPAATPRRNQIRRYVPRILGIGALLSVAIALWNCGRVYQEVNHAAAAHLARATWVAIGLTVLFAMFVFFRRRLFRVPSYTQQTRPHELKDLDHTTWWFLLSSALLAFAFFLTFWLAPLKYAALIGAPAILLFAAGTWIPLGSLLVYLGSRYQFPFLSLMFIAAAVFSLWNDNHALRSAPGTLPPAVTIEASAEEWLRLRSDDISNANKAGKRYPVFVVAAAGGGIRAAYWTASLLSALEDRHPGTFSSHTFAISGVSGGSLGAATFVALTAHNARTPLPGCRGQSVGHIRPCADAVLSQDFLAPVLSSMLYPDLTQRFLPIGFEAFDRARVIEGSWEQAWRGQGMPDDQLAQPLHALWLDDRARKLPLLFLNSTVVESGQRAIVSTVTVGSFKGFGDALDVAALTQAPMPLSSAAHLSARFTYVSPAASIFDSNRKLRGHLVDGGYFENSGGTTAENILGVLQGAAQRLHLQDNVTLWVIVIGNSPGYIADGATNIEPENFMMEVRSPLKAIVNARDARGRYAEANVAQSARPYGGDALVFGLEPSEVPLPLGWMLSDSAQHEIDRQTEVLVSDTSKSRDMIRLDELLNGAK